MEGEHEAHLLPVRGTRRGSLAEAQRVTFKVCAEPSCPALTSKTRCVEHARAKEQARGTRQARGYDLAYDHERAGYQRSMDAGRVFICWRCAELGRPHPVDPKRWHLGHDNEDRSVIHGPQCPESNLATSGPMQAR